MKNRFTAWQLGLSLAAALLLLGLALGTFVLGFSQLVGGGGLDQVAMDFLWGANLTLCGLLVLPSAGLALLRLSGRTLPSGSLLQAQWLRRIPLLLLFLVLPPVWILGSLVSRNERVAWLVLPPLHILAVGIPVLWLVQTGLSGLKAGSAQRIWGALAAGLVLAPGLALVTEMLVLMGMAFLVMAWISSQPDMAQQVLALAQRMQSTPIPSQEELLRLVEPLLRQPVMTYAAFAYIGLAVPLLEEAFKPAGVWLLAGRDLEPADGFVLGALSGAGYALFENLFLSTASSGWSFLILARIGAAVMHITSAGLTGYGLALAWKRQRYRSLALAYAAAVILHALWNGLTLLIIAGQLSSVIGPLPGLVAWPSQIALIGLGLVLLFSFGFLIGFNRWLRRAIIARPTQDVGTTAIQQE